MDIDKDSLVNISEMSDTQIADFMKENGISLKVSECHKIVELLGRNPTLTEFHIFNIQWSEHCSYKSSRDSLKTLPTSGPTVIQGPKEDAGIIEFTTVDDEKYGIVIGHESHNHPSQVVPYEGAATGIGGIVRDILCMGARIIATADPLRFGSIKNKNKDRTKYIANSVIDGISGYGNPIGVPNIAGDIYFSESYDDNCLVNVVSLGLIKEKDIIHSAAPKDSVGYDVVAVGKATDNSGFGGAAFASVILDEKEETFNKGAVQVPDPFLKNILIRATEAVFNEVRTNNIPVGFKDCGAGGIMCASSELALDAGVGMDIDIEKIHTSMDIPPFITATSETQERFVWVVPSDFTEKLLKIYNDDFELPNVAEKARASVIGKITKEPMYVMRHKGKTVCNAPVKVVTSGVKYEREQKEPKKDHKEPTLQEPVNYNDPVLKVLRLPQIASKETCYEHYDTEVQGLAVIRPGEADAGVMAPIPRNKAGIALSVDCNPRYNRISPFHGGTNAVAEAMRNVAAVGAVPYGMTDCLCYGNPEVPEQFWEFKQGVKGIAEAANNIWLKGHKDTAVPFVSGNVSFYNESVSGKAIDPSPIIACLGNLKDYSIAITSKIKKQGSTLFYIGERKDELGGSAYYELFDLLGKNVPIINYENERNNIYAIINAIESKLLLSCHDISDGGIITTISEMILGGKADGKIGVDINIENELRADKFLFSETSGFVFEVDKKDIDKVKEIIPNMIKLGETKGNTLSIHYNKEHIINLEITRLNEAWTSGFVRAMK